MTIITRSNNESIHINADWNGSTYSNSSGLSEGVLVETRIQNLVSNSESLSDWNVYGTDIDTETASNPVDGNLTPVRVDLAATLNVSRYIQTLYPHIQNETYTFSTIVKNAGYRYFQIFNGSSFGVANAVTVNFDLDTGAYNSVGTIDTTPVVYDMGDGWWYFAVTMTKTTSTTNSNCIFAVIESIDAVRLPTIVGSGSFEPAFRCAMMQCEQMTFPTSYVPTDGAPVTRERIVLSATMEDLGVQTDLVNNFSGQVKIQCVAGTGRDLGDSLDRYIFTVMGSTLGDRISAYFDQSGAPLRWRLASTSASTSYPATSAPNTDDGEVVNLVFRKSLSGFDTWINGVKSATDSSATATGDFGTPMQALVLANYTIQAAYTDAIYQVVALWPEAKTDEFLEALT